MLKINGSIGDQFKKPLFNIDINRKMCALTILIFNNSIRFSLGKIYKYKGKVLVI